MESLDSSDARAGKRAQPARRHFLCILWRDLLRYIADHYGDWRWWWHRGPVYRTGPMVLTSFIGSIEENAVRRLTILPPCAFFPMSDHRNDGHRVGGSDSISNDCDSLDNTYAVHLWSHT